MFDGTNDDKVNGFVMDQNTPTIGPNLIVNGSFESDSDWTALGGDPNAQTTEQVHSGTYAWKFERDGSETNAGVSTTANIAVETDTVYRISWWSYVPGANTSRVSYVNKSDGNVWEALLTSAGHSYGGGVIAGDTWVKQSLLFRTAASGTTIKLRFGNGGSAGADGDIIYFDDIELVKIGGNPGLTAADATFSTDTPDQQPRGYALDLDGTGDYLNLGDTLDRGTGDFSVCFWAKVTHEDMDDQSFISKNQDGNNRWRIRIVNAAEGSAGKILVTGNSGGVNAFAIMGAGVTDALLDTWMHVGATIDRDGDGVIYVNGVTTTYGSTTDISGATPEGVNLDNTGDFQIGAFGAAGMEGQMDGVAIWDEALPADAVAAIYAAGRGHDLTTATGNYDGDWTDDLQGYWRMGDGQDDNVEAGVIHDASNPGFGVDLVTNGTFDADSGWTKGSGWTISGGKAIASGDSGNLYQAETGFVNGGVYRVEYTISDYTKGSLRMLLYDGSNNTAIGATRTANGEYLEHVTINQASGSYTNQIFFQTYDSTDEDFKIDNVSVKKLNGYPGLTAADATFVKLPV